MADSSKLVTLALVLGGGYLAYRWFFVPEASASGTGGAAGAGATPAPPTPPAQPVDAVGFNSLDAIYARLASKAGSGPRTPDQFNFYLNAELPGGKTAPDPVAVFTDASFDRTATMSLANWWGAVAPWLKTTYGLSGLGVFGGLGALALSARGRR